MTRLVRAACEFRRDETGASVVEYALLLVLIIVVCFGAMTALGASFSNFCVALASSL